VSEQIGQGDYQPSQSFDSLGMDSLDFIEFIMLVEDETETDLDEERFKMSMTLQQFSEVLDEFL